MGPKHLRLVGIRTVLNKRNSVRYLWLFWPPHATHDMLYVCFFMFLPTITVFPRDPPDVMFKWETMATKAHVRQCHSSLPLDGRDDPPQEACALLQDRLHDAPALVNFLPRLEAAVLRLRQHPKIEFLTSSAPTVSALVAFCTVFLATSCSHSLETKQASCVETHPTSLELHSVPPQLPPTISLRTSSFPRRSPWSCDSSQESQSEVLACFATYFHHPDVSTATSSTSAHSFRRASSFCSPCTDFVCTTRRFLPHLSCAFPDLKSVSLILWIALESWANVIQRNC